MSDRHGPENEECREIFARLSEYLDGEIDSEVCAKVDGHLGDCPPCLKFLESLRRTVAWVQQTDEHPLPEDVRAKVRQAYDALREERGW